MMPYSVDDKLQQSEMVLCKNHAVKAEIQCECLASGHRLSPRAGYTVLYVVSGKLFLDLKRCRLL